MRVTQSILYNTYINDLMKREESVYELNRQISTGKRVNAPSDDPVNSNKILSSKTLLTSLEQYDKNINSGLSYLKASEEALTGIKDSLVTLKELAIAGANDTQDINSRKSIATNVSNLFDQIVSLGNTSFDGKYIFSGYKTATTPFDAAGAYSGDANKQAIQIAAGTSSITIGVNGGEVLRGVGLPGGVNIFQIVSDLKTALDTNNTANINAAIGSLDGAFNQVMNSVSDVGGKVTRLEAAKEDSSNYQDELKATISSFEDTDIVKAMSDLKLSQIALEASISSAAKIFNMNIFQYL